MKLSQILENCNPIQRQAILHDHDQHGPLLILAGAGSGKTSVLTRRIQWLITQQNIPADQILGLTFTAKAAAEMRERVEHALGGKSCKLCTFHSLALALLKERTDGGVPNWVRLGFTVAPVPGTGGGRRWEDQVVRAGIPRGMLERDALFSSSCSSKYGKEILLLQQEVFQSGAVVFEDLIWLAIQLLQGQADIAQQVRNKWRHILVDEYQDINPSQYQLVRLLVGDRKHIFVVGDDDQAIYGFRGADIGNILRFRKDYSESTILKLEWNYRSTPAILDLANRIFVDKPLFLRKILRPGNGRNDPLFASNQGVEIWSSESPREELDRLVASILALRERFSLPWRSFALLMRYNRQKEWYALGLRARNIPLLHSEGAELVDGVQMETIHGSKGLQYPVVYYCGLAEGISPGRLEGSKKAIQAQAEEEKRLFYVGVTRAEARLHLLFCRRRHWQGVLEEFQESPYLRFAKRSSRVVFASKIWITLGVVGYMALAMLQYYWVRIVKASTVHAWTEAKLQLWAQFCLRILGFRLSVEGQSKVAPIDWSRPVFVVANHQSYTDIPTVLVALQRKLGFIAKYELGRIPFMGYWMKEIGCLLIKRGRAGVAQDVAQAITRMGHAPNLVVFPEGTRSKDGSLASFKSGAFRMAIDHKAILLPLVLKGTRSGWENRKRSNKEYLSHCAILDPIDCAEWIAQNPTRTHKDLASLVRERMESELTATKL